MLDGRKEHGLADASWSTRRDVDVTMYGYQEVLHSTTLARLLYKSSSSPLPCKWRLQITYVPFIIGIPE
jgi:hypothetical protein